MSSAIEIHLYSLLLMVCGGIFLSFLYDIARLIRWSVKRSAWLLDLLDILYWCLAIPCLVVLFFMASWGQIRLYLFLGLALGALLYFTLASSWVLAFGRATARTVRVFFVRTIVVPLLVSWRVLINVVRFILRVLLVPGRFIGRLLYSLLPRPWRSLLRRIRHSCLARFKLLKKMWRTRRN